eukprot:UN33110
MMLIIDSIPEANDGEEICESVHQAIVASFEDFKQANPREMEFQWNDETTVSEYSYIGDGGSDMFDSGDYMHLANHNETSSVLQYSTSCLSNEANSHDAYMNFNDNRFVLNAMLMEHDMFSLRGYLGADDGQCRETANPFEYGGYHGYWSSFCGYDPRDGTINHIFITDAPNANHHFSCVDSEQNEHIEGVKGHLLIFMLFST